MNMTQNTKNDLLKRIAFFLGTYTDPNGGIMMEKPESEIDTRKYYRETNQEKMTKQKKKVGKFTSPNRVNRSTHYIGQPRSTGGNH